MDAGHVAVMGPSTARFTASAFCSPDARMSSSRASMMVPMPMVIAYLGTSSSVLKKRALSRTVRSLSVLMRVREPSDDPGSLNAMCPLTPMPRICRSMPPTSRMRCSYHLQCASMSGAMPSGTCV